MKPFAIPKYKLIAAAAALGLVGWIVSPVLAAALLVKSRRSLKWMGALCCAFAALQFVNLWHKDFPLQPGDRFYLFAIAILPFVHAVAWSQAVVANIGMFVAGVSARYFYGRYRDNPAPYAMAVPVVLLVAATQIYDMGKKAELEHQYYQRRGTFDAISALFSTRSAIYTNVAATDHEKLVVLYMGDMMLARMTGDTESVSLADFIDLKVSTCAKSGFTDNICDNQILRDRFAAQKQAE